MPKITVDRLVVGMCLAEPITNEHGLVLINEGIELTEALIEKIKNLRIESVKIKGDSKPEETKEEMILALEERFKNAISYPHMDTIKKIIKEHIERLYE